MKDDDVIYLIVMRSALLQKVDMIMLNMHEQRLSNPGKRAVEADVFFTPNGSDFGDDYTVSSVQKYNGKEVNCN